MKSFKLVAVSFLTSSILNGCVTGGGDNKSTATRRIIDQSPGYEGLPSWAKQGNKFSAEDNRIGFKGFIQMESDSKTDACTLAAGTAAKGRISSIIASSIMDESGIAGDDKTTVFNRLTNVLSQQKIVGIEIADEYWSIVEIDDGLRVTRKMECWAKVTIEKQVFENAMKRALTELGDDPKVSKHVKRLEETQEKMRNETNPST